MRTLFLTICCLFTQLIYSVLAEENTQVHQTKQLIKLTEESLMKFGYEPWDVGLGYIGEVNEPSFHKALKNLNAALNGLHSLHSDYENMEIIIIVPSSYSIPDHGIAGDNIQIVIGPPPLGKIVYIPYHLSTEEIAKELSEENLPEDLTELVK